MESVESGRELLIISNTYPTKWIRDIYKNPIVLLNTVHNKLLYLLWSQIYSDVFVVGDSNIEDYITDKFDTSLIFSDTNAYYFAKPIDDYTKKLSEDLLKALDNKDVDLLISSLMNPTQNYIEMLLDCYTMRVNPSIDYMDTKTILQNNVKSSEEWNNIFKYVF